MRNEKDRNEYLPPQEQLIIAAKINRLCEATPETFDPEIQVQDAQDIVNALNSRLKPSDLISGTLSKTSSSHSVVRAGITNAGNVNASFDETKTKKIEFGVENYRIGNYVAIKYVKKNTSRISFEHFWDRGMVNIAFKKPPERTWINYDSETLKISYIGIGLPIIKEFSLFSAAIIVITYRDILLWRKS